MLRPVPRVEQGDIDLGQGAQSEVQLGDGTEPAEAADVELGEVVAGDVLHDSSTGADETSVSGRRGASQDVIPHRAESQPQRSGGSGRHDRADGALGSPRRIESEPHAFRRQLALQRLDRHAGLHRRDQVGRAQGDQAIETSGAEAQVGRGIRGEPGAGAFEPQLPALLTRQRADHRERIVALGHRAGQALGVTLDAAGSEQRL